MKKIIATLAIFATFSAIEAQVPYKVIAPIPDAEDGATAYLVNYDTGETVDSATVKDHSVLFTGDVDEPYVARILSGDKRYGTLIVEQGTSTINQQAKMGVGTMLNDQLIDISNSLDAIAEKFQAAQSEQEATDYFNEYLTTELQAINDNIDSPIGYFLFIDYAQAAEPEQIMEVIEANPSLKDYNRVNKMIDSLSKTLATSVGKPYADFEVTYNGVTKRLSDYVGKGDYVLVDFWASWCGPCRREMKNLKELYADYADKGLKMLGVAVWDKAEDTEKAIKQMSIPWECIIDAQTIPTDIYGISGIPCVILFGPDGTILSRGKQGAALRADVEKYLK